MGESLPGLVVLRRGASPLAPLRLICLRGRVLMAKSKSLDIRSIPRTPIDWWLIGALLFPAIMLVGLRGAHLGEPVADDFDYLYYRAFIGRWSLFDGGGALLSWRPLARQLYFAAASHLVVVHPGVFAAFHLACACLTAGLLYNMSRRSLGPALAFGLATTPWLFEGARTLVAWPSAFQDLGALLFVVLAMHEAVYRRHVTAIGAGLCALLCKEVACVPLAVLPWCPLLEPLDARQRRRWIWSIGALLAVWAMVYVWVILKAHLRPPLPTEGTAGLGGWLQHSAIVTWWAIRAVFSLPQSGAGSQLLLIVAVALTLVSTRTIAALRSALRVYREWWRWGLLWSVPLVLVLVPFYPSWASYRMTVAGLGFVVAAMVILNAVHKWAWPAFMLLRAGFFLLAAPPAVGVPIEPPSYGAISDIPSLTRMEKLAFDVRKLLVSGGVDLPANSRVVWENFPPMARLALGDGRAIKVWYRDSTIVWLPLSRWGQGASASAVVEFQPGRSPSVALIQPDAMRALLDANDALSRGDNRECIRLLERAQVLQAGRPAKAFEDQVRGKLEYASALESLAKGRPEEARAHLERVLEIYPGDVPSRRLLKTIEHHDPP